MIRIIKASDGQHYFVVKSANGKVIVTSETYVDKRGAERGIKAMLRAIGDADTDLLHKINEQLQKMLHKP